MGTSDGFRAHVGELLEPMGDVTIKRMFGGLGVFRDGLMFGMTIDDALYLRADETSKGRFEREGCESFTYEAKGGRMMEMPYWRVPERLLEDGEELRNWAEQAFEISVRIKRAGPARKTKAPAGGANDRSASPRSATRKAKPAKA